MDNLLPCPFCGGEAHAYKNNLWHVACERAHNGCVTMSVFITEAEAVAAWNTRYNSEFEQTVIKAWKEIKDYQERTCEVLGEDYDELLDYWETELSCGHTYIGMRQYVNYCPKCGAKVVEK